MKKLTPRQKLEKRRKDAYKELRKAADEVIKKDATNTFARLGITLGVTGQTVYNYLQGKGKDFFLVEALTEEINNLEQEENN